MAHVRVQEAPFDAGAEIAALTQGRRDVGAVATFLGVVRDRNEGATVGRMSLEHYPGMTEKALAVICDEAAKRWDLIDLRVVHRVGPMEPGEPIVFVAVSSAHRGEAFAACEFVMDYLKTRAPFWKREETPSGPRWVDARSTDDEAAARWASPPK